MKNDNKILIGDEKKTTEVHFAMMENVEDGLLKIVGKNDDGEVLFKMTTKGERLVEAMPMTEEETLEWISNN